MDGECHPRVIKVESPSLSCISYSIPCIGNKLNTAIDRSQVRSRTLQLRALASVHQLVWLAVLVSNRACTWEGMAEAGVMVARVGYDVQ